MAKITASGTPICQPEERLGLAYTSATAAMQKVQQKIMYSRAVGCTMTLRHINPLLLLTLCHALFFSSLFFVFSRLPSSLPTPSPSFPTASSVSFLLSSLTSSPPPKCAGVQSTRLLGLSESSSFAAFSWWPGRSHLLEAWRFQRTNGILLRRWVLPQVMP